MNIQLAVEQFLSKNNLAEMTHAASGAPALLASKVEFSAALNMFEEHLKRNRHKEAVATFLALLRCDADKAISTARRNGLLRASRYKYQSGCLQKVVDAALQLVPQLALAPKRLRYLQSVRALLTIAPEARQLRETLVMRLHFRGKTVLKTLLVVVNAAFTNNWMGDIEKPSDSFEHWASEDIAEAFSALFMLYRDEFGLKEDIWQVTDEQFVKPFESIYASLLVDAARLNSLREAEVFLDGLPYEATEMGDVVTVAASDPNLEKSIRLGYIQADQQVLIRAVHLAEENKSIEWNLQLLSDFVSEQMEAGLEHFVQVVKEPIERLVFAVPNAPEFLGILSTDRPVLEELAVMYGAGIENFQQHVGGALRVSERLTAMDVIKVQRLFNIIDLVFARKLDAVSDEQRRNVLRVRSTIAVLKKDHLQRALEVVLTKEKAAEMVGFLTLQGAEEFVDVQYRPFIQAGEWYGLAPAVIGKSNLVRNIVTANRLRTGETTKDDPMQATVVKALADSGFKVREGFDFNISGKRETDIFCWRDGELFVFECKNAYHPCSAHELRTSFEHLRKAEGQLDIRLAWLNSEGNQIRLFKALGWDVPPTDKVHTCIVTANRAFTGYRLGAHPVRQAHELVNLLLRGEIGRGPRMPPVRFWRAVNFQTADLVDYLRGDVIVRLQLDLLEPFTHSVIIGKMKLAFDSYRMNLEEAAQAIDGLTRAG